jgi:hypothetical protein
MARVRGIGRQGLGVADETGSVDCGSLKGLCLPTVCRCEADSILDDYVIFCRQFTLFRSGMDRYF